MTTDSDESVAIALATDVVLVRAPTSRVAAGPHQLAEQDQPDPVGRGSSSASVRRGPSRAVTNRGSTVEAAVSPQSEVNFRPAKGETGVGGGGAIRFM